MVINSGTNNLTNTVNTLQKIRKVINAIKENDVNDEIELFSQLQRQNGHFVSQCTVPITWLS